MDNLGGCVICLIIRQLIQVGDKIPDATVYGSTPKEEIKVRELFAGKKAVVFGVPGAPHLTSKGLFHVETP